MTQKRVSRIWTKSCLTRKHVFRKKCSRKTYLLIHFLIFFQNFNGRWYLDKMGIYLTRWIFQLGPRGLGISPKREFELEFSLKGNPLGPWGLTQKSTPLVSCPNILSNTSRRNFEKILRNEKEDTFFVRTFFEKRVFELSNFESIPSKRVFAS